MSNGFKLSKARTRKIMRSRRVFLYLKFLDLIISSLVRGSVRKREGKEQEEESYEEESIPQLFHRQKKKEQEFLKEKLPLQEGKKHKTKI